MIEKKQATWAEFVRWTADTCAPAEYRGDDDALRRKANLIAASNFVDSERAAAAAMFASGFDKKGVEQARGMWLDSLAAQNIAAPGSDRGFIEPPDMGRPNALSETTSKIRGRIALPPGADRGFIEPPDMGRVATLDHAKLGSLVDDLSHWVMRAPGDIDSAVKESKTVEDLYGSLKQLGLKPNQAAYRMRLHGLVTEDQVEAMVLEGDE